MKSNSPLLSMLMSRSLTILGTSVIFALTSGIVTTAQTSPSRPPAPWAKTSMKAKPVADLENLSSDSNQSNQSIETSSSLDFSSNKPLQSSAIAFPSQISQSIESAESKPSPFRNKREQLFKPFRGNGDNSSIPQTNPSQQESNVNPVNAENAEVAQGTNNLPNQSTENSSFQTPDPLAQSAQEPVFPSNPVNNPTESVVPANPAPNELNSSGNPLIFPTNPQEVDTTVRQPITLNQAIELALRNNKDFQAARIALEKSEANLTSARAALFPSLSTEFDFSRDNSAGTELQNALTTQNAANSPVPITPNLQPESTTNAAGTVQLTYNIFTGGERSAQIEKAEKQLRSSRLQVEVTSEQTRFSATDSYYALQGTDAQVAIAQASVEDASQSLRDARLLEQAGLGTRFDVLRAEGDLATANEALTRAISDQRTARRRLVQVLGVGQKVELTAADPITEAGDWTIPLDKSIVQAYKNRAELEQQLLQVDIYEQDRFIALSAIQPKVDFLANYNYQNNFNNSVGLVDGYSFAARVRWTFFDGGRAFAEARKADRDMDTAQTEFGKQRDQIRFDVEESYYTLTSTKENISSTRTNVTRFEEALRLARLRFQAGVGTQTDVINAQRDLANARGRYLQAIIGYNQALNKLQRAVSNLPDNKLFEIR
jgi:outer membrane factor, OMF family